MLTLKSILLVNLIAYLCITVNCVPVSDEENMIENVNDDELPDEQNEEKRFDRYKFFGGIGKRTPNISPELQEHIDRFYERAMALKPYFTNSAEEEQYMRDLLKVIERIKLGTGTNILQPNTFLAEKNDYMLKEALEKFILSKQYPKKKSFDQWRYFGAIGKK